MGKVLQFGETALKRVRYCVIRLDGTLRGWRDVTIDTSHFLVINPLFTVVLIRISI